MMASGRPQQPPQAARRWPAAQVTTRHQAFICSLPCLGCGKEPPSECAYIDLAHVSDRFLVPLCGPETVWEDCCHSRLYFLGPQRWSELDLDPCDLARSLWRLSGDREAGTQVTMRARARIALSGRETRP
jgi:hypothetical protein